MSHSDFWLKEYDDEWDFIDDDDDETYISGADIAAATDDTDADEYKISDNTSKLIRLSSARRAISNYVSILTNQNIPVMFNDENINCTDGKTVYLSSDITKKENFDVAVGLALHEGSHIKYSDMDLFKKVWMEIPRAIYDYTEKVNISKDVVGKTCKDILNYVEDRFIDFTVHKNAPGYRPYYDSLYDKYFNCKSITDALKSNLYKSLSVDSYMFRIINLTNPDTSLTALPGLYEIAKTLNLSNIERLQTPKDRLDVAYHIAEIVFKHVTMADDANNKGTQVLVLGDDANDGEADVNVAESAEGDITSSSGQSAAATSSADVGTPASGPESGATSNSDVLGGVPSQANTSVSNDKVADIGNDPKISKSKLNKILKAVQSQKEFLGGTLKKKKVSKRDKQLLDVLEKSKVDVVDVAQEFIKSKKLTGRVECIFVKNMTWDLISSDGFPMYVGAENETTRKKYQECVNAGIVLGTKIGRRLQLRNEINTEKFSRRNTGKIDRRLLHELGFMDENVFYTTLTQKYKKINFHISVDASSSMNGKKWERTMKLCVALAKAASILENVHITISFRTTKGPNPYILIAYNSKVDKFSKVKNLFANLRPNGTTPEGLCYEAIMRFLPTCSDDTNSYFVNISDGQPFFSFIMDNHANLSYSGPDAAQHTRNQVNKIRTAGYTVLSYFISEYTNEAAKSEHGQLFQTMYGNDASFINVENISQVTGTLNKKMMDSLDI